MTAVKKWPFKRLVSIERDHLVVFYFPNASEIWPDKRDGIWWVWSYKRETTAYAGGGLPLINVKTWLHFFKSGSCN